MLRCVSIACVALALLAGCCSFEIVQNGVFVSELGAVVKVGYGRAEKPHNGTFVNPATGKKTEFLSRLAVEVEMPDGETFTAWQTMNFTSTGTMYRADNGKWMFHANGFTCLVYRQLDDGLLHEVYRGVLCDAPKTEGGGDDKWRELKKDAKGKWR